MTGLVYNHVARGYGKRSAIRTINISQQVYGGQKILRGMEGLLLKYIKKRMENLNGSEMQMNMEILLIRKRRIRDL